MYGYVSKDSVRRKGVRGFSTATIVVLGLSGSAFLGADRAKNPLGLIDKVASFTENH